MAAGEVRRELLPARPGPATNAYSVMGRLSRRPLALAKRGTRGGPLGKPKFTRLSGR